MKRNSCLALLLIMVALAANLQAVAQLRFQSNESVKALKDSSSIKRYRDSVLKTLRQSDTSINTLLQRIDYYSNSFGEMKNTLNRGFDTVSISRELPGLENNLSYLKRSLAINEDKITIRFLYTVKDILENLEKSAISWQTELAVYNKSLIQMQSGLYAITKDSTFNVVPADSALRKSFFSQFKSLGNKWRNLDTLNRTGLLKIGLLQNRVAGNLVLITDYKEQVQIRLNKFAAKTLHKEEEYLWRVKPKVVIKEFLLATRQTIDLNLVILKFYLNRNWPKHLLSLTLVLSFYFWIRNNLKNLSKQDNALNIFAQAPYTSKFPFLASIVFAFIISPYFYNHPPTIFIEAFLSIMIIAVGFMINAVYIRSLRKYWTFLTLLTIFYAVSNLFMLVSYPERSGFFIANCLSLVLGWFFYKSIKRDLEKYPKYSDKIVIAYLIFHLIAMTANFFGRFSIAKIASVTATFSIVYAFSLLLFVRIITEGLFLQIESGKTNESRISSYLNFKNLQERITSILYAFTAIIFLVFFFQNLNIFDYIYDYVLAFLVKARKMGDINFSYSGVLIFLIIIWVSVILARIIAFIFEVADENQDIRNKKNKLSSSILIIRLAILTTGFLLAFGASGIPLEKITIIIGALSVGIGFGLQNIVNNLISGIILAFEKPIQIGDLIEVGNRTGIVREMGIRSSKISTYDGSEVIVPNGDLLSQHLINWTLSDNHRRAELTIGVAYGSSVENVKTILEAVIDKTEGVMKDPKPAVLVNGFGDNAVNFRILFWVNDLDDWLQIKSKVMSDIYEEFYKADIKIPFPQRDVHLFVEDEVALGKSIKKTADDSDLPTKE